LNFKQKAVKRQSLTRSGNCREAFPFFFPLAPRESPRAGHEFRSCAPPDHLPDNERLSLRLTSVAAYLDQRSSEIRESAGIEHLDARVSFSIEGGGAWGTGFRSVRRGIEPQA
jgi:hypothetical protein